MSVLPVVRNDLRLQVRHGFPAAYAFVALAYVGLLRAVPGEARAAVLPPVLLTEASVIGFFFAGAILHLERGDGTLATLAVTPLRTAEYLMSKMISLALLGAAAALAVTLGAVGPAFDAARLGAAAALTTAVFTAAGLALASRFASLDRFVVWGGLASAALGLSVLPYLGILPSPLWSAMPTYPTLMVMGDALGAAPAAGRGFIVEWLALAAWPVLAFAFARRWVDRHAFGRGGGGG